MPSLMPNDQSSSLQSNITQFLTPEIIDSLYPFQAEKIAETIDECLILNKESRTIHFETCPKCGALHPHLTKGGYTGSGKLMLRCHECNRRFVADHGSLTYYSHQSQDKWDELIKDTVEGNSIAETAKDIGVSIATSFRMRHKFLGFAQSIVPCTLDDEVEMDEKYLSYSHKGTAVPGVKSKKRGTPAKKRGISSEQVCLLTAVERAGNAVLKAVNMGRPAVKDILELSSDIEDGTYVWTDGLPVYNSLITSKHCGHKVVKTAKDYDKVNHLNNVNSFHSRIEAQYTKYRSVATKYINRYAALFIMQRKYRNMEPMEYILDIRRKLKSIKQYFYIRQIRTNSLFTPVP